MTAPRFPTLQELIKRGASDWRYETGSDAAGLPGRPERALVKAQAGQSWQMNQKIAWAIRQFFIRNADDEDLLVSTAASFGVDQKPASRAAGQLDMQGTPLTVIPDGFRWARSDGVLVEAVGAQVLVIGGDFNVRAVTPGADANTDVGVNYYSVEPLAGLTSPIPVSTEIKGGIDREGMEALRDRLLFRLRNPPGGGTLADYKRWALEVPGVTRAWAFDKDPGLGWVTVLFVRDEDGVDDLIFPNPTQIAEVQAYLDARKPGGIAGVVVDAPDQKEAVIEVSLTVDTTAIRAAVLQSIKDMLFQRAEPPAAADVFYRTWIAEAISIAAGEVDHTLVLPAANVALNKHELYYYNGSSDPIVWS